MEHRGASVRGDAGSSLGTGGTACSETFSFFGVDTTMVTHALSVLWQRFRQLTRFALSRSTRHKWTTAKFGGLVPGLRIKCTVFDLT